MGIAVKIAEHGGIAKKIFIVFCIILGLGSTYIGINAYESMKANPIINPHQNDDGDWEIMFFVKDTAFIHTFDGLYMSLAGKDEWSQNLCDVGSLESGRQRMYTFTIDSPEDIIYDFRAYRSDGMEIDFYNVDLSDTQLILPLYDDTQMIREDKFTVNIHPWEPIPETTHELNIWV